MKLFLVTFAAREQVQGQLVERIKKQGAWARITPFTWCIKTDNISTFQLRDILSEGLTNEKLLVVDISNSSWASFFLPSNVANWLKSN